jgi:hypothetical protein
MAITLSAKTVIVDGIVDTDATIATALGDGVTYTSIYGFTAIPISNTKTKIIIIYA